MTNPIGQTFFINEPPPPQGTDGVFVTRVDVYFKAISSYFGIQLQIRQTENGAPTTSVMPFADKILYPGDINLQASDDASVPSSFIFDTPVFLPARNSYSLVLIPLGGNPDYDVWTSVIGGADVTTNAPIYTNNDTGDLFLSSNDLDWTPVITEDMKFTIYTANFTANSGTATFYPSNTEIITYMSMNNGNFINLEPVIYGSPAFRNNVLSVNNVLGTFNVNDTVYQTVGNSNIYGTVNFANSSVIKITDSQDVTRNRGIFSNSTIGSLLYNSNSTSNANILSVSRNTRINAYSNTISVPDSSLYSVGNTYYFINYNKYTKYEFAIVSVTNIVNTTSIQVNTQISFSTNNAVTGYIYYNGALTGLISSQVPTAPLFKTENLSNNFNVMQSVILNSTSNSSVYLPAISYTTGLPYIFGQTSKASAQIFKINDRIYHSGTIGFLTSAVTNTSLNWFLSGVNNDISYTPDTTQIPIENNVIKEFIDEERLYLSNSNEFTELPSYRQGNNSITISASLSSNNMMVSPVIDSLTKTITLTTNVCAPENHLNGYLLNFITTNNQFIPLNSVIEQTYQGNTSYGTSILYGVRRNYMLVIGVNGVLTNTSITTINGFTANVISVQKFSESLNFTCPYGSRYISKNVTLAVGQDSEDMHTFLTAYRPANTNLLVFAKIQNGADSDDFTTKDWSKMTELSSPSLVSSAVNNEDFIELEYGFNESMSLFNSKTSCSNTSNTVTLTSTVELANNNFIYLVNNDTNGTFNVREIVYVVNSSAVIIDRPPSFTSTNAAIGMIPGIETTSSAFLYDRNNNIVRYCTYDDNVFDGYIQFAMKIVPVADSPKLVPKAKNIRSIALQV